MTVYVERDIASVIPAALRDMPVTIITGMRQTPKTFLQNNPNLKKRGKKRGSGLVSCRRAKKQLEIKGTSDSLQNDNVFYLWPHSMIAGLL